MNVFQITLILSTILKISSGGSIKNLSEHFRSMSMERQEQKTMEEALLIFFEEFRCRMRMEMVDLNLPTLDPFTEDFMDVELDHELGHVTGVLSNLRIDGLSDFVVNDLEFNFEKLDLWIDATLPRLSLAGWYDIDGELGGLLPIFGHGNFSIVLAEMHVSMNATIGYDGFDVVWEMPEFQMDFHLGALTTAIENLFNDDELADFFNLAFTTLGSEIVDVMFPEIEPQIADMAKQMTPEMLNGVTIDEFLDIIFLIEPFFPDLPDDEICEYEINYPKVMENAPKSMEIRHGGAM
ncbi:uncharacterized protein LOC129788200 [Lutzomyia longipalpis]|uniref:uncharacterized protein LOC129788200 n=1 Tax=Lutzomyia longipalpis TaxID=7200 RepID=UPI002483A12A|nr:uncharacterized protein LOC129788200 [Lutzomyia longipalpis]